MDAPETLTDVVISTLKQRDLLIKRDVIASAFTDPATSHHNAEWVAKHLHPDTLLSREELTLQVPSCHFVILEASAYVISQVFEIRKLW